MYMKKISTVCIFVTGLLLAMNANAQIYLGKVDLQSYVGTWKYETPEETLILKLKDTVTPSGLYKDKFYDTIIGTYQYQKNGDVIVDNMNMLYPCKNEILMPIYASPWKKNEAGNIMQLRMTFRDTKTGKSSSDCIIAYVSPGSSEKKIRLILKDETDLLVWESLGQGLDPEYDEYMKKKKLPGWTIPNNVVLIKQE